MKIRKSKSIKKVTVHSSFSGASLFSQRNLFTDISFSDHCACDTVYYPAESPYALRVAKNTEILLSSPALTGSTLVSIRYASTSVQNKTRYLLAELSPSLFDTYGIKNNQRAYILNLQDMSIHTVTLCKRSDVPDDSVFLSNKLKNALGKSPSIAILLPECLYFGKCNIQGVDKIRNDVVSVNKDDYLFLKSQSTELFELRHLKTGACITLPLSKIDCNELTPRGSVKLSFYCREALNVNTAKLLTDRTRNEHKYTKILNKISRIDPASNAEKEFRAALPDDYHQLQLFPIYKKNKVKSSLWIRLCNTLIGESSLSLLAVRPYSVDDSRDIVRLSNDSMQLLGIEDGDRVVLTHNGKNYSAMALQIDSFEFIDNTNILLGAESIEMIVGVPAPIRSYLGIDDIETGITVSRDTSFLLKKNLNIQLMPLAALILTVFQLEALSYTLRVLICIILSPFIMYATLSQERNKVKRSNSQQK